MQSFAFIPSVTIKIYGAKFTLYKENSIQYIVAAKLEGTQFGKLWFNILLN